MPPVPPDRARVLPGAARAAPVLGRWPGERRAADRAKRTCRALLRETARLVSQGTRSTEEPSRAKVFISEATGRIVDRAVQLTGGIGITEDSVIGRIYADIRAFRIYDG